MKKEELSYKQKLITKIKSKYDYVDLKDEYIEDIYNFCTIKFLDFSNKEFETNFYDLIDSKVNEIILNDIEKNNSLNIVNKYIKKILVYKNPKKTLLELVQFSQKLDYEFDYIALLEQNPELSNSIKEYLEKNEKNDNDTFKLLIEAYYLVNNLEEEQEEIIYDSSIETSRGNNSIYLQDIGNVKLLSLEEEKELGFRILDGDQEARKKFMESNLRLVVSIAKHYVGRGLEFLDLVQEGNLGLMKAVDKFDVTKGYKFSTYATWWIRQAIIRSLANHSRTIRLPAYLVAAINKITMVQRKLTVELNREPTEEEIAQEANMSIDELRKILVIDQTPVSLEKNIGEDDDSTVGDFIIDSNAPSIESTIVGNMLAKQIYNEILNLPEKEAKVICMRYGLEDGKFKTLEEVGEEFGVTRERIRQIEAKALTRLKCSGNIRKIKGYSEEIKQGFNNLVEEKLDNQGISKIKTK